MKYDYFYCAQYLRIKQICDCTNTVRKWHGERLAVVVFLYFYMILVSSTGTDRVKPFKVTLFNKFLDAWTYRISAHS